MTGNTALQFSGGKDSLACLHLYRKYWDVLRVVWLNTGAAYDETVATMREWQKILPHFIEVKSDQPANIAANGWPVDILPINHGPDAAQFMGTGAPLLQSYLSCCAANVWLPMQSAMRDMGVSRIIRGQKNADRRKSSLRHGDVIDGVEYLFPIAEWTDADVMAYLAQAGAEMPAAYLNGEATGRDCWDCTAYLDENVRRIETLPDDRRAEVMTRIDAIKRAIFSQWHGDDIRPGVPSLAPVDFDQAMAATQSRGDKPRSHINV